MNAGILAFIRAADKRQQQGLGDPAHDVTIELTTGTARRGHVTIDKDHPDVVMLHRRLHGPKGSLVDAWQGGTAAEPYVIAVQYIVQVYYSEDS